MIKLCVCTRLDINKTLVVAKAIPPPVATLRVLEHVERMNRYHRTALPLLNRARMLCLRRNGGNATDNDANLGVQYENPLWLESSTVRLVSIVRAYNIAA